MTCTVKTFSHTKFYTQIRNIGKNTVYIVLCLFRREVERFFRFNFYTFFVVESRTLRRHSTSDMGGPSSRFRMSGSPIVIPSYMTSSDVCKIKWVFWHTVPLLNRVPLVHCLHFSIYVLLSVIIDLIASRIFRTQFLSLSCEPRSSSSLDPLFTQSAPSFDFNFGDTLVLECHRDSTTNYLVKLFYLISSPPDEYSKPYLLKFSGTYQFFFLLVRGKVRYLSVLLPYFPEIHLLHFLLYIS